LRIKEIKQEQVNKLVNWVKETDENNLNWPVLLQIVINTVDEAIGKRKEW
jgi:hypothetical protein